MDEITNSISIIHMHKDTPQYVTTAKFAEMNFVKPCTVQRRHSLTGQYFNVVPIKHPSGKLLWPAEIATR